MLLDIVFSLDSVITAVGMADDIEVMVAAVVIAVMVMLVRGWSDQRICQQASNRQDAGAQFPPPHRHVACCRRLGIPHSEGVHLLGDGVRGFCGDAESPVAQADNTDQSNSPDLPPAVEARQND